PTLALESDAQPPKTQSELLSLLAFGQSTTSLLATGSSSIAGSAATLDLFGVGAQAAVRRLAARRRRRAGTDPGGARTRDGRLRHHARGCAAGDGTEHRQLLHADEIRG